MARKKVIVPDLHLLKSDVDHLHACVEEVKAAVAFVKEKQNEHSAAIRENTRITLSIAQNAERAAAAAETVRDVQATFKITLSIGKWIAAVAAAVGGVIAAVNGLRP